MTQGSAVTEITGVGLVLAEKLAKIGIFTVKDLLDYFPRKYDDYSDVVSVKDMMPGYVTLKVTFANISERRVKRGLHITQAEAIDQSGKVRVIWFNQPYRASNLTAREYLLRGTYEFKNSRLQIVNPSIELVDDIQLDKTIIATYPERVGLKNHQLRKIIQKALVANIKLTDTLPKEVTTEHMLLPLEQAYKEIHIPETSESLALAKRRFAFEELFVIMTATQSIKDATKKAKALPIPFNKEVAQMFVTQLPFDLTDDQRATAWKILQDMESTEPMNRLVEGDVGSGKTVVAAMALLMALENGMQVAFIAPTEILARQHFKTIQSLLSHTQHAKDTALLVGSLKKSEKQLVKEGINNKTINCVVGTHALFEEDVSWHSLGLVIIDEQHRFGVKQRQKLHAKSGTNPHILCMTATPIPRSLALTVYGELDISIIKQKPVVKAEIATQIVSPNSTQQMYEAVKLALNEGRQAYIVCPLITESEVLNTASAEETYKVVRQKYLKEYRVGLLHGKMKPADKDAVMQSFKDHELDVLVATTVIEVGVDVPNATDMIILGADRFGLAQLHQLRGRVGRGIHPGRCYLVMSDSTKPSKRMHAIVSTNDGFELAEYDLEIRGAGAIYGTSQHGELDLRHVQLSDHQLIAEVRSAVNAFTKKGDYMVKYPQLAEKITKTLQLTYLN
jgi:ATP-dependent DNA helicase RecG